MNKYTSPGDADASSILQAEMRTETEKLRQLEAKLSSGNLAANDAKVLQDEIVRARGNVAALSREMKTRGVPQTGAPSTSYSVASSSQSPSGGFRVSGSGPVAAAISSASSGGIGDYISGILRQQMDAQQAAIQAQQGATTRAGQAAAAVTRSNQDRGEQILNERLRVQGQFGLGPSASEDAVAATLLQLQQNDAQYLSKRKEYDAMVSTNFFSDPIGWLSAQLNRGTAAAEVNALADNEEFLVNQLTRNLSLSEEIERTVQINTNEIDRRTADFQARQQLAEAEARVASLQAEGARANMSAAALYGSEVRKDQRTESQKVEDELAQRRLQLLVQDMEAKQRQETALNSFTGSVGGERALDNKSPEIKNAIQSFINGAAANPVIVAEHGAGLRVNDPPLYQTASKLSEEVRQLAGTYKAKRKAMSPEISWKMADDEDQAWLEIRNKIAASNAPVKGGGSAGETLTGKLQDTYYNPLRADHLSFVEALQKGEAAAPGSTPISPNNLMAQMYAKLRTVPSAKLLRNPVNGQLYVEHERAILSAIRGMALEGKYKLADGSPVTPEVFGSIVAEYYKAASSWTQNLNKAERFGLPRPSQYNASVPKTAMDGSAALAGVDLMNPTAVSNWLKEEVKVNQVRRLEQERVQKMMELQDSAIKNGGIMMPQGAVIPGLQF